MSRRLFLPVFLLILSAETAAERAGHFRIFGPGGGGAQYHPTISPHDPKTVLVSCDMTGAYITHDSGRSWRMFNLRGTVRLFAFDPQQPKTIYAQATGLWRSTDSGRQWQLVWPRPGTVQGIRMSSDHADETIVSNNNPVGDITALAISPKDSNTLLAGSKTGLWRSTDQGETWKQDVPVTEAPLAIWIDDTGNAVYAAHAHGLTVRANGAWLPFRPAPAGVTFTGVTAGFLPDRQMLFYATSGQGAFLSTDAGLTWKAISLPGAGARVQAVATSRDHPQTVYLSYSRLPLDNQRWLGVARSTDRGVTWHLVWKEAKTPGTNIHDAWISPRFGPGWGENPLALGVDPHDPKHAYATDLGRTLQTNDAGSTWDAVYSQPSASNQGGWISTGLDVTSSYGIHFDPHNPRRQFITYTDIGLFRSDNGGESWISSTNGVPEPWLNTTYWIAFDPDRPNRLWAAMSGTHDLPRPKMWRRTSPDKFRGGICLSDDGGKTWKKSSTGMPETAPTHLLIDPSSPAQARVLYAAAFGRGIYKSADNGSTWTAKNNGITQNQPFAWRLALDAKGTLYALVARRSENGSIGNEGDGALYRSTDGAETWSPIPLPAGANAPNGLAIDPTDSRRLYLATWARNSGMHGEGGGIWLSTDAGATWRNSLDRDQHVYDITIDRRNPSHLYAAGFESSAWRSIDRGEHWTRIPGFNFKWGHRVIPDPVSPNSVYITTFGGSVWHGAVDGKPALEDISTPVMQVRP